jgi:ankyrin repeat protein
MDFRWSDNELDNSLFAEFSKENPDEKSIRGLIKKGANINAIDCKGDSVLLDAITYVQDGLDLKFIKLIIDLGADINYVDEDLNCLYHASMTLNTGLVEMLLKAGANPNCVSAESAESLLDWAECEEGYLDNFKLFEENTEKENEDVKKMTEIIQLLKEYGAKPLSELYADLPEKFLIIFATYHTGLITATGNLKIENIPNADPDLIISFKNWLNANPDAWKTYEYAPDKIKISNPPDYETLKEHNAMGLQLAKKIKKLLGQHIKVEYYFVNPTAFIKHKVRNVDHLIIN